jgi:hypothetical protein
MENNYPIAQRFITISIDGVQDSGRAFYSYTSPIFGTSYVRSPKCDISIDQPTYTLFLLDFASTMNGWAITGISPKETYPSMETQLGPMGLSIMTINPYDSPTTVYKYYIHYRNSISGAKIKIDPQEGNIPPPTQMDPR